MSESDILALIRGDATIPYRIYIDGNDTPLTENEIISTTYEDYRYVDTDSLVVGQFVARTFNGEIKNINRDLLIENKEIEVQMGVKVGNTTTWYSLGNFLITKPKEDDVKDKMAFQSKDYTKKFNKKFDPTLISFPCTALELAQITCSQCGVTLGTTDFTNADFIIENNQYEETDSCRKVMQDIGKLAYSWVRIGWDNKCYIDFEVKTDVENHNIITNDEYYDFGKQQKQFGPVNRVVIGLKDVDGENVAIQDDTSIAENGLCELHIYDNNLTYTPELRQQVIEGARRLFGLKYVPVEVNTVGHPWLIGNELARIIDMDGNAIETYPFDRTIEYAGHIKTKLVSKAETQTQQQYINNNTMGDLLNRTKIVVDKQNKTIQAVVEQSNESSEKVAEFEITLEGISNSVSSTETKVKDLESSIDYFSVDLAQYTLTIPTNNLNKPLETKNYDIPFYGYYKGKQVTPSSVTISGDNTGITTSKTNTYLRFAVTTTTAITSLSNNYTITFTYNSPDGVYTLSKMITITLSIQGKDGADGTSGNDGKSAYQIWLDAGNTGTEEDYLNSLKGKDGEDGYTPQKGIDYFDGKDGENKYFYVRYSANANGNPMTTMPQDDTEYMGTANTTSSTPPTSYTAYIWVKIKGTDGTDGTPGTPGENGLTPYLHIMYSQDGKTFVPEVLNEDGTILYSLGKKPSAWIGQYTDYTKADSVSFDDYEWYKFTEDIDDDLTEIQQHLSDNTNAITTLKTEMEQTNQSFAFSVEELQTQMQSNSQRIDDVDTRIDNGVEVLRNKLITIDINGITVSTNSSAISTLLSNDRFSIKSTGGGELFFVGYDYEQQKTVSRIDNLTVANYLTSGYHRTEGFEIDGEYRTGDFYIGV